MKQFSILKLNEVLGVFKKIYPAETHLSEKPKNKTNIRKVHSQCNYVDGSIVNGRLESFPFPFDLSAPPGFKIFKEPTSTLFKKVNKEKINDKILFGDDENSQFQR